MASREDSGGLGKQLLSELVLGGGDKANCKKTSVALTAGAPSTPPTSPSPL